MKGKIGLKIVYLAVILALILSGANPVPVNAAGAKTHTVFAQNAITIIKNHGGYQELADILNRYPDIVNYGSLFPDITYGNVDNDWANFVHDDDVGYSNYGKYLRFMDDQGYDKNDIGLTANTYKEFLEDPNYAPAIPKFRGMLMAKFFSRLTHTPRSADDEKAIAFLFGLIAHQEADWPWHWNPKHPNEPWLGTEQRAINLGYYNCGYWFATVEPGSGLNSSESCLDLIMYKALNGRPGIDNNYINTIKSDVIAAANSLGMRAPQCLGRANGILWWICPEGQNADPFLAGLTQISYLFDQENASSFVNSTWYDWLQTYVPGGIDYGSAYVAGSWMATWDFLSSYRSKYYVQPDVHGAGDCSSWNNACPLAFALGHSLPGQEIWVAGGVYKPTNDKTDRNASFSLVNGISLYGGFAEGEDSLEQRNWYTNRTILSGDIDKNDEQSPIIDLTQVTKNSSNSYHVVKGANGAILDGFVVTGGYANLAEDSKDFGGGMLNYGSSPTVRNVTFAGNYAIAGGGMINKNGANPQLSNVTFLSNQAAGSGGALENSQSSPTLTNVTIAYNISQGGEAIANHSGSHPAIRNTILWGNSNLDKIQIAQVASDSTSSPTISDSVIQGGYPGAPRISVGNPNLDVLPKDPDGTMPVVALKMGSAAINRGNASFCTSGKDQRGVSYVGICDIGAVEYDNAVTVLHVRPDSQDPNGTLCQDWTVDHACTLTNALKRAQTGDEIWVMAGTYIPNYPNTTGRGDTIELKNTVALYGGFVQTDIKDQRTDYPTFADRDPDANPTILSGDIDGHDSSTVHPIEEFSNISGNTNNSYHVVTVTVKDSAVNAVLDGFQVYGGYANNGAAEPTFGNLGGGLLVKSGSTVFVSNVSFIGNYAQDGGGAVDNESSGSMFSNVDFQANKAGSWGGAVKNAAGSSSFTKVVFKNNEAGNPGLGNGGAVDNNGSNASFTNAIFESNTAKNNGGAMNIVNSNDLTLNNVTFKNNTAGDGGAVSHDKASGSYTGVTFDGNAATWEGGAMFLQGTDAAPSAPTLTNVTFYQNHAVNGGGAIGNITYGAPILKNVTIYKNWVSAGGKGGGIYNFDGNAKEIHLWNTILWGNYEGQGNPSQSYNYNSANYHVDDSVVQGGCPGGASCSAISSSDPLLAVGLGDNGGFTKTVLIQVGSPAINKGNPAQCSAADQRSVPVVGVCDIGAYEYSYQGTYYVKPEATGGDCQSWTNACAMQTALNSASKGDEIWALSGTYYPTSTSDPTISFHLANGVGLYGGFAGTETARDQRNPVTNVTTLSGDIGITNQENDNSYHVVYSSGVDETTVLDSFMITGGNASYANNYNDYGGGMLNNGGSPTVSNVTFVDNNAIFGGGMANIFTANTHVSGVTFLNNRADQFGGGIDNDQSSPEITNATFTGNQAGVSGGAINNMETSKPVIKHITVVGNTAGSFGGGMNDTTGSEVMLYNSIFWGNTPAIQILKDPAKPGTLSVMYCIVENGYDPQTDVANHNFKANPVLSPLGNYGGFTQTFRLMHGSPAIEAGDSANSAATDQRGVYRPQGQKPDIGAYEANAYIVNVASAHGTVVFSPSESFYLEGDVVQVTVQPYPGWRFNGWTGDVTSNNTTISLTLDKNYNITANFITQVYLPAIRRN